MESKCKRKYQGASGLSFVVQVTGLFVVHYTRHRADHFCADTREIQQMVWMLRRNVILSLTLRDHYCTADGSAWARTVIC